MTESRDFLSFSKAMDSWVQTTSSLWGNFSENMQKISKDMAGQTGFNQDGFTGLFASNLNALTSFMEKIGDMNKKKEGSFDPDAMSAQMESITRFMQLVQKQGDFIQKRFMENSEKFGEVFTKLDTVNSGSDFLQLWKNIYESEIRKVLNIPQVGLGREYQERMLGALDRFALFHANAIELLHFLYIPLEQSFLQMQKDMEEMLVDGKMPEDQEEYYKMWLSKLEKHYMELFRSSEYTSVLGKTLSAMGDFKSAKDAIIEDTLQFFPIPTRSEMDELYKEIYVLKRRIRDLEKAREL